MNTGRVTAGRAFDATVVTLAALGLVEIWAGSGQTRLAATAAVLLGTLPLLVRRRFPFAAPVAVFAVLAAFSEVRPEAIREDGSSFALFALLLAFWVAGARNERNQAAAGAAGGLAAIAVLAGNVPPLERRDRAPLPGDAVQLGTAQVEVVFLVVLAAALSLGAYALRARALRTSAFEAHASRLEQRQAEEARAAVLAERDRIAEDLHGVIANGVNVMTVQAGAARTLLGTQPQRAREPLLSVEETGRQTLAETRRLLGILRSEHEEFELAPRAGSVTLDELVAQARAAALPVEVDEAAVEHKSRRAPLGRRGFDVLVGALAVVSLIELAVTSVPGPTVVLVPAILLWTLPLLWRRRFPLAAPVAVFAALTASTFFGDAVGGDVTSAIPLFLAFWTLGAHNERRQAVAGAAIGFACLVIVADQDVRLGIGDTISAIVVSGAVALVAYALSRHARRARALEERAEQLEREREEQARAAVAAERRRVARDLHDVMAHSISVMTVQAGAARMLLDSEPERAREPLLFVEETGRQTLGEMRRLLDFMHGDEPSLAPRPALAAFGDLLAQVRTTGLAVELVVEGEPREIPPGVELAAYRIVQEALTNARKHATPDGACVTIRYEPRRLELEVANEGRHVAGADSGGHGLVGMRERAALYGGELEAGARAGGGFVVRARLPVEPVQR